MDHSSNIQIRYARLVCLVLNTGIYKNIKRNKNKYKNKSKEQDEKRYVYHGSPLRFSNAHHCFGIKNRRGIQT